MYFEPSSWRSPLAVKVRLGKTDGVVQTLERLIGVSFTFVVLQLRKAYPSALEVVADQLRSKAVFCLICAWLILWYYCPGARRSSIGLRWPIRILIRRHQQLGLLQFRPIRPAPATIL